MENLQQCNQNRSKMDEGSIKIDQQSTKILSWKGLGAIWAPQIRFGTDLDISWGSTWGRFRGQVGVMLEPC